jgi:hypothetical protein
MIYEDKEICAIWVTALKLDQALRSQGKNKQPHESRIVQSSTLTSTDVVAKQIFERSSKHYIF